MSKLSNLSTDSLHESFNSSVIDLAKSLDLLNSKYGNPYLYFT